MQFHFGGISFSAVWMDAQLGALPAANCAAGSGHYEAGNRFPPVHALRAAPRIPKGRLFPHSRPGRNRRRSQGQRGVEKDGGQGLEKVPSGKGCRADVLQPKSIYLRDVTLLAIFTVAIDPARPAESPP